MGVNVLAVRREEGATVLLRPSPSELPALLRDESVVVWVNLDGRDAEAEANDGETQMADTADEDPKAPTS